jgi:hypothetical protein
MKTILAVALFTYITETPAVTWTYQVNVNNEKGSVKVLDNGINTFKAGPHHCEVSQTDVKNSTEYRSLICGVETISVSTGGLCTQKGSKFSTVQYAILNMTGIKNLVNVVVACKFD